MIGNQMLKNFLVSRETLQEIPIEIINKMPSNKIAIPPTIFMFLWYLFIIPVKKLLLNRIETEKNQANVKIGIPHRTKNNKKLLFIKV